MDCAAEESEIRLALEPIQGIRSLSFQLGARTLRIDADDAALEEALVAIKRVGFKPVPLNTPAKSNESVGHDHDHTDAHTHGEDLHEHAEAQPSGWLSIGRYVAALVLATTAELLSYFAPDAMPWRIDD